MTSPISLRSLAFLVWVASSFTTSASAGPLWYNGDNDNRDTLTNENKVQINIGTGAANAPLQKSLVYDNFVVPTGQSWAISSVFSNDQIAYGNSVTTATWEIRSGVSAGNGGTLVASGDTAATQTAVSPVSGYFYGDTEYTITASVTGVTLTAGTYWLAIAPDAVAVAAGLGTFGDQSYIETTSGANSLGLPAGNDGQSFITDTYPVSGSNSDFFTPTTTALDGDGDGPTIDFSMGVNGALVVPEPSSLVLVTLGLIAGSAAALRRRRLARRD